MIGRLDAPPSLVWFVGARGLLIGCSEARLSCCSLTGRGGRLFSPILTILPWRLSCRLIVGEHGPLLSVMSTANGRDLLVDGCGVASSLSWCPLIGERGPLLSSILIIDGPDLFLDGRGATFWLSWCPSVGEYGLLIVRGGWVALMSWRSFLGGLRLKVSSGCGQHALESYGLPARGLCRRRFRFDGTGGEARDEFTLESRGGGARELKGSEKLGGPSGMAAGVDVNLLKIRLFFFGLSMVFSMIELRHTHTDTRRELEAIYIPVGNTCLRLGCSDSLPADAC